MGQRLRAGPADAVVQHIALRERAYWGRLWPAYVEIQRAHAVMLSEQGLLSSEELKSIQDALAMLEALEPEQLQVGPAEDLYFAMERFTIEHAGQAAGRLHIGRSRNDLNAAAVRMLARGVILDTVGYTLEFQRRVLDLAKAHVGTVMPGMTHRQTAQPITLGFWLLGVAGAVDRDLGRLRDAYHRTNLNPLGAAALAGTCAPINRERTSELLGFEGLVENALDAVASRDFLAEIVFDLSIQCITMGRVASDVIMWNTSPVRMAELADAYAGISSIMPQKKNPLALEHCRARAGLVVGELMALLSVLRGTFFEHCRDTSEMIGLLLRASEETRSTLVLLGEVLASLRVNSARMAELAGQGFSTSTDVADWLALERRWSFRTAHSVVAHAVAHELDRNPEAQTLDLDALEEASLAVAGESIGIEREDLHGLLTARCSAESRRSRGGTSSSEVRRGLGSYEERWREATGWANQARAKLHESQEMLRKASGL